MPQIDKIENIVKQSKENGWPYPKTFSALKEAGVTSYEVNLSNYEAIYFCQAEKWQEPIPEGYKSLEITESFSQEAVKEALSRHQQSHTNYLEWLAEMAAGGVHHYRVDMVDNTVTYYDKDEHNSTIESVPS